MHSTRKIILKIFRTIFQKIFYITTGIDLIIKFILSRDRYRKKIFDRIYFGSSDQIRLAIKFSKGLNTADTLAILKRTRKRLMHQDDDIHTYLHKNIISRFPDEIKTAYYRNEINQTENYLTNIRFYSKYKLLLEQISSIESGREDLYSLSVDKFKKALEDERKKFERFTSGWNQTSRFYSYNAPDKSYHFIYPLEKIQNIQSFPDAYREELTGEADSLIRSVQKCIIDVHDFGVIPTAFMKEIDPLFSEFLLSKRTDNYFTELETLIMEYQALLRR